MNQKRQKVFYWGILLIIIGNIALALLPSTIGAIFMFIASAAFISSLTFWIARDFFNAPIPDEPIPPILYSDNWSRAARLCVVVCVFLALVTAAILLFLPPPKQCPNWHLPNWHLPNKQGTPLLGMLLLWTAPILAWMVFVDVRWKWFVEKAIESDDSSQSTPVTYTMVGAVLGFCAASQLTLAFLVGSCWLGL